jgi:hypothetical protein
VCCSLCFKNNFEIRKQTFRENTNSNHPGIYLSKCDVILRKMFHTAKTGLFLLFYTLLHNIYPVSLTRDSVAYFSTG